MRAEALSWDDWSAVNEPAGNDDDKWHVELAPDDVKVVTLEQLDDLFRLSIVDAETKVWQTGMSEWLPLGVIADLDEKPPAEPKRSHPKPPSPRPAAAAPSPEAARPQSAPPRPQSAPPRPQSAPPRPQSAPPRPQSAPPRPQSAPPRPQSAPPRPQSAPPPAAARSHSVPPRAVPQAASQPPPAPAFYPQALAPTAAPLAFAAPIAAVTPVFAQPSVRPLVVSHAPPRSPARAGVGRLLIGAALIAGVAISLYRNGLVHDAALAMHQEALYDRLEAALGGPAFGTLRALEQSAAVRLPASSAPERIGTSRPFSAAAPAAAPPVAAAPAVEAPQPAPGTAPPVVSLESLAREKKALAPGPKAEAVLPAKSAPASKAPAAERPQPVSQKPEAAMTERERLNAAIGQAMSKAPAASKAGAKSKASEYDPLNPKL